MHVFLSQKKILRSAPWFVMFSSSWSIILLRSLQTEPRALLTFVSPKRTHTHTNQSLSAAGVNGWKRTLKVSQSTLLNKNTVTRHALAGSISTPLMFWTDQVLDVNDVLWLLKMLLVCVCDTVFVWQLWGCGGNLTSSLNLNYIYLLQFISSKCTSAILLILIQMLCTTFS